VENQWWFDRCREVQSDPNGYVDLWFREGGKSTVITIALTIQDILCDPEITIGIFSHTRPIAKSFLRAIKREFESNLFLKKLFPDILYADPQTESPKWAEDQGITVKRNGNPPEATIEAHGLVDGAPTGRHFQLRVYDDVVTLESVSTPEQMRKVLDALDMSSNLGKRGGLMRMIGTRYKLCTVGDTLITMGDFSQKKIKDVCIGDEIVGWEKGDGARRVLKKSRVLNSGVHLNFQVFKYTFNNGRSVTCTKEHLWWRGAHWSAKANHPQMGKKGAQLSRGREYGSLGFGYHESKFIHQLLIPTETSDSWDAGWLGGFFDGEGTIRKNPNHPSANINLVQTVKNMDVIEQFRLSAAKLGYSWSEQFYKINLPDHHDKYVFSINGGWRERYRFLTQCRPSRNKKLIDSLYGQMFTDRLKLEGIEDAGYHDVYWLETETGNYIADGFCSKNSDAYEEYIKRGVVKPRIYPATDNGRADGTPRLFTQEEWENKLRDMSPAIIASQMLQNPLAQDSVIFQPDWVHFWPADKELPAFDAVFLSLDGAFSAKSTADDSCILALGLFKATEGSSKHSVMVLDCYMEKVPYPELRDEVLRQWSNKFGKNDKAVDAVIIEDKSSGSALIPELRRAGITVYPYSPGNLDKTARANLVSHLVRDGYLWMPESRNRKGYVMSWLSKMYEQLLYFPNVKNDDGVDSLVQALSVLDKAGFLRGRVAVAREQSYWKRQMSGNYG